MTYIGLSPPNTFTKSTSQTFTGNGSTTAFTLQTRVSSPEDLEVFVSNVQQQPTESYTIGSDGVTMTFSEAPPSGTFYVIYRTIAQQAGTDTGASRLIGDNTFTGNQSITGDLTLTSTDAGASAEPTLTLYRNSASPADSDNVGEIIAKGRNDNSQNVEYSKILTQIIDVTDGTEDGNLGFYVRSGGSQSARLILKGNSRSQFKNRDVELSNGVDLIFEGATANSNEIILTPTDPTAVRTITLPDATGTVALQNASIDMNGTELILDADADTSITADTDDQIDLKVGGTDTIVVKPDVVEIKGSHPDLKLMDTDDNNYGGLFYNNGSMTLATDHDATGATGIIKFAIDGSEKARIASDGNFGISTTSPDAKLDVEGTTDAEIRITRTTATTASTFNDAGSVLNLVNNVNYENGYNGGASIGQILFTSNDSSTGTGVRAKISCKASTYYHAEDLQFFVSPSNTGTGQVSATSQTDGLRMNIAPTGKTSIFADSSSTAGHIQNAFSSPYGLSIFFSSASPNNTTNWFLSCADNASQNFIVFSNGDAKNDNGVYTSFSDERLKTNIVDAKSQWEDIKALKFKNFIKFSNPDLKQLGLVAQDVEKTSPNLVFETPPDKFEIKHNSVFGTLYEEGDELPEGKEVGDVKEVKSNVKNVKDSILYMKSVKALQEAIQRIETLEAKVKILEEA